ncbi:MAG: DSD1 family PLP-dependent enzyme [Candidatus Latescibacteria bacterium]|nr:DSD1 family PLP-dependent enzyme [Candidatus Latescibacterota bacterium]
MSEVGLRKTELDTPVLWVDLDKIEHNIATLAGYFKSAGVNWRPHTKGIKVPAIAHKAIAAGAIGVTCAKLGEAEVMASAGIHDILIANQIVGSQKITRLVNLRRHADVKILVDSEATLAELGEAARAKDVEVGILVELNTGMDRTGVAPGRPVVELSRKVHQTLGLRFMGLMTWEGHACVEDDLDWKRSEIEKAVGLLTESAALCREAGLPVKIISAGGSGTYKVTPFLPGVTEIQAGGAIFNDVTYQTWGVETTPSLFVRTTVVSRPTPYRMILDAGFKTLPAWHGQPQPVGLSGVKTIEMSAEHGNLTLETPDTMVKVGDAFDFVVGYTDETLFLHDNLYGIRDGIVEVVWPIQGRGKLR